MTIQYTRQRGIFNPMSQQKPVFIVGCGSLGSVLAVQMARLGFKEFHLWDDDYVEAHNIPNQAFIANQVGERKVSALQQELEAVNPNVDVTMHDQRFDAEMDSFPSERGIIINAPDDIEVRKAVAGIALPGHFIVDVRSGNTSFNVLFCDRSKAAEWDYYSQTFFDANNVAQAGADCNAISTVYTSHLISALALQQIVRYVNIKDYHLRIDGCLETLQLNFIR